MYLYHCGYSFQLQNRHDQFSFGDMCIQLDRPIQSEDDVKAVRTALSEKVGGASISGLVVLSITLLATTGKPAGE